LNQQGLPPIIRGIIKLDEKTQDRQLLCEGHALLEVMNTPGKGSAKLIASHYTVE